MKLNKVIIFISMITLSTLTACANSPRSDPNKQLPNLENFPMYPGAQKVTIADVPAGQSWIRRTSSFQTQDKPEDVLTFYQGILEKGDWRAIHPPTPVPNLLIYDWGNGVGQPGYRVVVEIKIVDSNLINVELTFTKNGPE